MSINNWANSKVEIIIGPTYNNKKFTEWVEGSFETQLERSAAYASLNKLMEIHPELATTLRGEER